MSLYKCRFCAIHLDTQLNEEALGKVWQNVLSTSSNSLFCIVIAVSWTGILAKMLKWTLCRMVHYYHLKSTCKLHSDRLFFSIAKCTWVTSQTRKKRVRFCSCGIDCILVLRVDAVSWDWQVVGRGVIKHRGTWIFKKTVMAVFYNKHCGISWKIRIVHLDCFMVTLNVHPKIKVLCSFTHPHVIKKTCIHIYFCHVTQKIMFWRAQCFFL